MHRVDERRLVRALLASTATGAVVYLLVVRGALPLLTQRVTSGQIDWLRSAFRDHPWMVLGSIAIIVAILALPVLAAFRIAYGPMSGHWRRSLYSRRGEHMDR
jgi:Family of unknown function (DUF6338)